MLNKLLKSEQYDVVKLSIKIDQKYISENKVRIMDLIIFKKFLYVTFFIDQ